jgi:hypothetical protein
MLLHVVLYSSEENTSMKFITETFSKIEFVFTKGMRAASVLLQKEAPLQGRCVKEYA